MHIYIDVSMKGIYHRMRYWPRFCDARLDDIFHMTDDQLYGVDWRFTRYHHNYHHLFENDGNTIREGHATHSMMCLFDNLLEVQMLEKFIPMRKKITAHQISFPFEAFLWRTSLWLFVFRCPRHRHRPNPSPSQVLRRHPPATFQQQAEQRHQPTYLPTEIYGQVQTDHRAPRWPASPCLARR